MRLSWRLIIFPFLPPFLFSLHFVFLSPSFQASNAHSILHSLAGCVGLSVYVCKQICSLYTYGHKCKQQLVVMSDHSSQLAALPC